MLALVTLCPLWLLSLMWYRRAQSSGPLLFSLYLLPLVQQSGSMACYLIVMHMIARFMCHLERMTVRPLLDCLDDIKAWMSLNFLSFNENKTEVMVFRFRRCCVQSTLKDGSAQFVLLYTFLRIFTFSFYTHNICTI